MKNNSFLLINIHSIKKNIGELKKLIAISKTTPDIIAINETKLHKLEICRVRYF